MQWSDGASTPTLKNATMLTVELERRLHPDTTLVMRAQNSGDMYHIREAMVLNPRYCLLIWNVTEETKKQAQQAIDVVEDLGRTIYYTGASVLSDGTLLTTKFNRSETWATKDIATFFTTNLFDTLNDFSLRLQQQKNVDNSQLSNQIKQLKALLGQLRISDPATLTSLLRLGRQELALDFANSYGAYSSAEGDAFRRDLAQLGHFPPPDQKTKYVIVNFRATGHSTRSGANAPALDTGLKGMEQIMSAVCISACDHCRWTG